MQQINRPRLIMFLSCWLAALLLAVALDRPVAAAVRASGAEAFLRSRQPINRAVRETLKAPGVIPFTLGIAAIAAFTHPQRWRAAIFLIAGCTLTSLNQISKWTVGRTRPFTTTAGRTDAPDPFYFEFFAPFNAHNLSFPSGHAALAFATAAGLSILWPRWRWAFFALAACVGAERVLENAHWLSDVVAAAALGIGGVWIVRRLWWDKLQGNSAHGLSVPVAGDPSLQRAGKHSDAASAR